ncbi:MAG: 1-acylglycerol-3-phosphate O-acyltransferase [Bacteroidetes bacterium]|nr:1-acylglycerol-3-phosphate O-acyltransferase [Bacteroidota bacterium]
MRAVISVIRIFFFSAWSLFCILAAMLGCLLTISTKPTLFLAKHLWAPVALFIMGAKLEVKGVENIKPGISYVVMSNHCSYLDIPALLIAFPIYLYFIAKKELKRMPFLGWFIMLAGMIFIDRKNRAAAKASLAYAAKLIHDGKHVIIFPEGTASKNGEVSAFKKGGFHLAQDAEAHIIPVHVTGAYVVWPSSAKLNMQRGKIVVTIGAPVSPETYTKMEMDERIEFIRSQIIQL